MSQPERIIPEPSEKPGNASDYDPRVYMAAERTFLAWIRTGLALMGFGFVIARFGLFLREIAASQQSVTPPGTGFSMLTGTALIGVGILVNVVSIFQHRRYIAALDRNDFRSAFDSRFSILIAALMALLGCGMAVFLLKI